MNSSQAILLLTLALTPPKQGMFMRFQTRLPVSPHVPQWLHCSFQQKFLSVSCVWTATFQRIQQCHRFLLCLMLCWATQSCCEEKESHNNMWVPYPDSWNTDKLSSFNRVLTSVFHYTTDWNQPHYTLIRSLSLASSFGAKEKGLIRNRENLYLWPWSRYITSWNNAICSNMDRPKDYHTK